MAKPTISIAICTLMKYDMTALFESLVATDCLEILLIGNTGEQFQGYTRLRDPRFRIFYTGKPLEDKMTLAWKEARGDVLAFVDDDAVLSDTWFRAMTRTFEDEKVGLGIGPSILPETATRWERLAQMVMQSTQYSWRRYGFAPRGEATWVDVLGANMAFRKKALDGVGGFDREFPSAGADVAIAHKVAKAGWKVFYDPEAFIFHKPHPPKKQIRQVISWGRVFVRLERHGVVYPKTEPQYKWFIPTYVFFGLLYVYGRVRETLFPTPKRK